MQKFDVIIIGAGASGVWAAARAVVDALLRDARGANFVLNTRVLGVHKNSDDFVIATNGGDFIGEKLVVATGGMSYANLGVDDIGYKVAKQFGHKIIPPRP